MGLDGNVHLVGTQGVGKSTLLRAILFFYNAGKSKLGIPIEKKRFDDYYFEYQNSYIVYEVVKDKNTFCVLAYRVNGKVAFRFFNSEYKKSFFISDEGSAFDSWDKTRDALGKQIYYTKIISSYDEYRKILYGDNKGLKAEFRRYALIESKQYQSIPRTIQNVLLNSNLEAKFIRDTIINSISEDEFKIDVSNYYENHLRNFETQINDIKVWSKKNKKGQIIVQNQADTIIENHRIVNFLKRGKKELAVNLSNRINYIQRQNPKLLTDISIEITGLEKLRKKKDGLKELHRKREQEIISEIDYIKKKLSEAEDKKITYKNIESIIKKVAKKDALISKEKALGAEKQLLNSNFAEISQKYSALISQVENQQNKFRNEKDAEVNLTKSEFEDKRSTFNEAYKDLIEKIKNASQDEKEKAKNELQLLIDNENNIKRKKAELKHKALFDSEIKGCEAIEKQFNGKLLKAKALADNANIKISLIQKEWELEQEKIEQNTEISIKKESSTLQSYLDEITVIEGKLKQIKSSFYGWLNDSIPNWEDTIGKVIDEKNVLFSTNLNPMQLNKNDSTFFGIELNLNAIDKRVETVDDINQKKIELNNKIIDIEKIIIKIEQSKDNSLSNLKIKFRKKIGALKDTVSENKYIESQSEKKLKMNTIALKDWNTKASSEKRHVLKKIEDDLGELSIQKEKSNNNLELIKKRTNREITKKEKERDGKISAIEGLKDEAIKSIKNVISKNNTNAKNRIDELKRKQNSELNNSGADTERLNIIGNQLKEIDSELTSIKNNEVLVIEYKKDKRELFDKVPQFKTDKHYYEKKKIALIAEQKIEQDKLDTRFDQQNKKVENIKAKIDEFKKDIEEFNRFKITDIFLSVQKYFSDEINDGNYSKTAIDIIKELNGKHYSSESKLKELQQSINSFIGNFNENNIFSFKVKFNKDDDFFDFATELKEFIEEDKINDFKNRINERFAHIIQLIGKETNELQSKEAEIERIITKINNDFKGKNFVDAIKGMEIRTQESSNPVVKLLIKIKEFNEENSLILGESSLFTSPDTKNKNNEAVELLRQLVKELEKYKNPTLTLSESFELQFKIVENDNDSGWVEKLSNVGSEGTDVLVKAMINILLLNVFKKNASKKFKDFKLHCMMDEIGRLHPNNVKGILRFANERNILLINGSPISQNPIDYKYTYKLSKEQSKTDSKKYITKIILLLKKVVP